MVLLSRDTYLEDTRNYLSLTIKFSLRFCSTVWYKRASVRIGIKGSWRLWFGKWVLYFHRMLHITNQVLEVLWPLTLSAKICGHVTWVVCYKRPMETLEFCTIADVSSAVFL